MNCTYIDCIMYFQDDFDNHSLRFESNMTPAQLCMYGVIQYHFDPDVPEGEILSNGIDYHGPPPCELHLLNDTCMVKFSIILTQMYPKEKHYPMELIIMVLHLAN